MQPCLLAISMSDDVGVLHLLVHIVMFLQFWPFVTDRFCMLRQEATHFVSIGHVKDFAIFLLAAGAQCASNSNC